MGMLCSSEFGYMSVGRQTSIFVIEGDQLRMLAGWEDFSSMTFTYINSIREEHLAFKCYLTI